MSLRKLPLPSSQPRVRSPSPGPFTRSDVRLPLGSNAGCWLVAPPCGAANSNVPDSSGGVTSHHGRSPGGAAGAPAPAPVPGYCIEQPVLHVHGVCVTAPVPASVGLEPSKVAHWLPAVVSTPLPHCCTSRCPGCTGSGGRETRTGARLGLECRFANLRSREFIRNTDDARSMKSGREIMTHHGFAQRSLLLQAILEVKLKGDFCRQGENRRRGVGVYCNYGTS